MLELATDLPAVAGERVRQPTGQPWFTTSLSFALSGLTNPLVPFQDRHPRIELEPLTVDRAVDLVSMSRAQGAAHGSSCGRLRAPVRGTPYRRGAASGTLRAVGPGWSGRRHAPC